MYDRCIWCDDNIQPHCNYNLQKRRKKKKKNKGIQRRLNLWEQHAIFHEYYYVYQELRNRKKPCSAFLHLLRRLRSEWCSLDRVQWSGLIMDWCSFFFFFFSRSCITHWDRNWCQLPVKNSINNSNSVFCAYFDRLISYCHSIATFKFVFVF